MQNWQKYRNFRKKENADGSFSYTITVDGENVEVSAEIYEAYAQGGYKMENMELGLKRDRINRDSGGKTLKDENGQTMVLPEREVSLDKLVEADWEYPSSEASPEVLFLASEFSEEAELYRCLALLADEERTLVEALFFEGLTETEYGRKIGIKQQNVHKRKVRILKKIKNFWG